MYTFWFVTPWQRQGTTGSLIPCISSPPPTHASITLVSRDRRGVIERASMAGPPSVSPLATDNLAGRVEDLSKTSYPQGRTPTGALAGPGVESTEEIFSFYCGCAPLVIAIGGGVTGYATRAGHLLDPQFIFPTHFSSLAINPTSRAP